MRRFLGESIHDFRFPASGELLECAHVEVAVVKERFELGHVVGHKAAVLADAVAAQGRGLWLGVLGEKGECLTRGLGLVDRACLHALDKPRASVVGLIPLVHRVECRIALFDREHRAFGEKIEILVGDDCRDLNDAIARGQKPGHLEIDPN